MVDVDHFVELLEPSDGFIRGGLFAGAVELAGGDFGQGVVNQGGFAAAGHAGDAGNQPQWQFESDVFEVVAARAFEHQHALGVDGCAHGGHGDGGFAA